MRGADRTLLAGASMLGPNSFPAWFGPFLLVVARLKGGYRDFRWRNTLYDTVLGRVARRGEDNVRGSMLVALLATLLLLAGCMSTGGRARYTQQEIDEAAELVDRYYQSIADGDYRQALMLLASPEERTRDWKYEQDYLVRELQAMERRGEYRLSQYAPVLTGGENRPIGGPEDLIQSKPLRFLVGFQTDVRGKPTLVNEIASVQIIEGRFRIVNFESVDHFVRFRSYAYDLPRVNNAPEQ